MSKYFVESTKESVKDIFKKRQLFKIVSRSKYPSLIDFRFAEKALYGRVNRLYQPMVLNENHLQLEYLSSGNPAGVQVFNFVADAFRDLQNKFKLQVASGQLDANDNYLTDLIPMAGYKSPKTYMTATQIHTQSLSEIL